MANIIMVLIVFMLVMSVMGVILFDIEEINLPNFQNGLDAWFTVFICVTQDGWADILEEFINFGVKQDTLNNMSFVCTFRLGTFKYILIA